MKMKIIILCLGLLSLAACTKSVDNITSNQAANSVSPKGQNLTAPITSNQFVQYTILKGKQYCDKSTYQPVKYDSLSFVVKFDSSAIYQTSNATNQDDINKLIGFSDNNATHQQYSARFGWRWSKNALRLFGYIYNNGVRSAKEISTVNIGRENSCSIKVSGNNYVFTVNGKSQTMPRGSKTVKAEGYKLFPYFGGDEMAPHTIEIWIKEL